MLFSIGYLKNKLKFSMHCYIDYFGAAICVAKYNDIY